MNALHTKIDSQNKVTAHNSYSSVPFFSTSIPKDHAMGETSEFGKSIADSLPRWYRFDMLVRDGESGPQAWLCCCEQFFEMHKIALTNQSLFASYFTREAQLWYYIFQKKNKYPSRPDLKRNCVCALVPVSLKIIMGN